MTSAPPRRPSLAASGGPTGRTTTSTRGSTKNQPQAEVIAQHAGYLFVANTRENGVDYRTRLRWSHSNNPDAWAAADYIDISEGGGEITADVPFSDRLLIFKRGQRVGALRLRRRDLGI